MEAHNMSRRTVEHGRYRVTVEKHEDGWWTAAIAVRDGEQHNSRPAMVKPFMQVQSQEGDLEALALLWRNVQGMVDAVKAAGTLARRLRT